MKVVGKMGIVIFIAMGMLATGLHAQDDFDFDSLLGDMSTLTQTNETADEQGAVPEAEVESAAEADVVDEGAMVADEVVEEEPIAESFPMTEEVLVSEDEPLMEAEEAPMVDEPIAFEEPPMETEEAPMVDEPVAIEEVATEPPMPEAPATIVADPFDWLDDATTPATEEAAVMEEPALEEAQPGAGAEAEAEAAELVQDEVAIAEGLTEEEKARAYSEAIEVRRQADEINGLKNLDQGFQALRENDFEKARTHFEVAVTAIPERPATVELRDRARWGLAEAHYRLALNIYREDGDLRAAMTHVDRALSFSPNHRGVSHLQSRIARAEARRLADSAKPIRVEDRAEYIEKTATIEDMLREGADLFSAGEYTRSEAMFDNVLIRDKYNVDAMRYLQRIAERKMKLSTLEREATTEQMMQSVRDAWNPPKREAVRMPDEDTRRGQVDTVSPARQLENKMASIIIPRIEFRQANIRDVVTFLRDASEAADPVGGGVNIILNLNVPGSGGDAGAAAPAPAMDTGAADDPWGADPWGGTATTTTAAPDQMIGSSIPSITLNLRRISLLEAIRYITEVAGLKFRVEDSVVLITPAGVVQGRVVTRLYPVQPSFMDVVGSQEAPDAPAAAGGFGGGFSEFGSSRPPVRRGDVKAFFEQSGVPFPLGTSITYNQTISQLIVANTPENLDQFERILAQLNVVPSQVEIEARFVEVAQSDLQELGLQWILTDNYEFLQKKGSGPLGGQERVQVNASEKGITSGMRFFGSTESGINPVSKALTSAPAFAGDILSISSVLTNPEMTVVLHALSQNGNVDLLSAPRVTTRSGVNASIEVVTEIIYPTEFRVTEPTITGASGSTGSAVISPPTVTPDSFETRRTGVILNVTPTVGPDGYTIDLALSPEVAELVDWIQYGSRIRVPNPAVPGEYQEFLYNIPQPVFASRNVTTSIVIWDGQTVVMGGLMRERMVTIQDKIPFLGDIPVIGRLFRTDGTQSRKENLLIFVTARLVDPAGKPIQRADTTVAASE